MFDPNRGAEDPMRRTRDAALLERGARERRRQAANYRSLAQIGPAIEALDREIAAAQGRRIVRQVRVTTEKGL